MVKSIALKAKKESSDDETWTSESDDEEYAMADDKKGKSDRKCFRCGDPNQLFGDCPKPPRNKDQKAFVRGCWSDSENEVEDKINGETCLMAQSSNEGMGSTLKADGSTIPGSVDPLTIQKVAEHVFSLLMSSRKAYIILNKYTMKVKESLNMTFDESPPPTKLSPLVDDDVGEEEAIENNTKVVNNNNMDDESIEVERVVNIKESKITH
ncbi:retrovirus-related pol polyprotein from transposon TNT 1-94 [Tanacetum coccineum]|uniref:Retrovirus-related pol polyprotein from transposon TNT 1-94 n=2 Tax=Tanacetum coccineum TaxID=301880 RepID=A0ABQ4Y960_9ASTR